MIHQFDKKKRVLFFPTGWANSVASWCAGVSSPTGTIRIKNTLTPKEGGVSLEIDINEERIASLALHAVETRTQFSDTERNLIKGMFQGATDQKILTYRNDLFGIDMEALRKNLGLDENGEGKLQENQTDASTAGKSYDISTAALLAAKAPADTGLKALSQESDTEKIARIGGSPRAAREDHKHPLNIDPSGDTIAQIVKNGEDIPLGSSTKYARADHTHDLPELDADDIWYGDLTVGEEIDELLETQIDHEDRITALESATPPTPTTGVTSVNGDTGPAVVLTADDIEWDSGYTIGDCLDDYFTNFAEPLDGKAANLMVLTDGNGGIKANEIAADANNARYFRVAKGAAGVVSLGTIPSGDITDANCTSGGDCIAYFDSNKHLAHLGNSGMTVSKLQIIDDCFDWVKSGDKATDGILNYLAFGESAAPTSKKMVIFAKDDPNPSLVDFTAAELQPNAVISTDEEWNTQAKVAAAAPKDVYELLVTDKSGTTETNASKIKRIGTSSRAAREDHQHLFPYITGASTQLAVWLASTGGDDYPSGATRARQTIGWERGVTGTWSDWTDARGNPSQTSTAYNGVRIQFVSRIERSSDYDILYLRYAYFDKNGCLYKIDGEAEKCFYVCNKNFQPV